MSAPPADYVPASVKQFRDGMRRWHADLQKLLEAARRATAEPGADQKELAQVIEGTEEALSQATAALERFEEMWGPEGG